MAAVRARLSRNRAAAEHSQVSGLWQRREGGADGLVVLQRVLTQQALLVPHCEQLQLYASIFRVLRLSLSLSPFITRSAKWRDRLEHARKDADS